MLIVADSYEDLQEKSRDFIIKTKGFLTTVNLTTKTVSFRVSTLNEDYLYSVSEMVEKENFTSDFFLPETIYMLFPSLCGTLLQWMLFCVSENKFVGFQPNKTGGKNISNITNAIYNEKKNLPEISMLEYFMLIDL